MSGKPAMRRAAEKPPRPSQRPRTPRAAARKQRYGAARRRAQTKVRRAHPRKVVYVRGSTPVKIFFRLCLQNLFSGVDPQTVVRVEAMLSMVVRCSKGGGYGSRPLLK